MSRSPIISNTCTFSQQILLEALIVTEASASFLGEQYRDLLLYLHQKLDENNIINKYRLLYIWSSHMAEYGSTE